MSIVEFGGGHLNPDNIMGQIEIVTKINIANQLYDQILSLIVNEKLSPGFLFPSESNLCNQLNVGRSTLREAYKALEAKGYITRSKRGTYVNSAEKIAAALPFSVTVENSDLRDLMEFRLIIETKCAEFAAKRANDETIRNLRNYLSKMKENSGNLHQLTLFDTLFHMELVNATGNQLLKTIMHMSYNIFASGMFQSFTIETLQNVDDAILAHEEILAAIILKDSKLAYHRMLVHLKKIIKRMSSEQ